MKRLAGKKESSELKAKNLSWTFLTNHGHVLILLSLEPEITVRDMSIQVGITERAVQRILAQLIEADYVDVKKVGRRNRYLVDLEKRFRHPIEENCKIKSLITLVKNSRSPLNNH